MPSMIQIRNVPEEIHRRLKARAAMAGMSLSELLLREIRHIAERPTTEELVARVRRRGASDVSDSAWVVLRSDRDSSS